MRITVRVCIRAYGMSFAAGPAKRLRGQQHHPSNRTARMSVWFHILLQLLRLSSRVALRCALLTDFAFKPHLGFSGHLRSTFFSPAWKRRSLRKRLPSSSPDHGINASRGSVDAHGSSFRVRLYLKSCARHESGLLRLGRTDVALPDLPHTVISAAKRVFLTSSRGRKGHHVSHCQRMICVAAKARVGPENDPHLWPTFAEKRAPIRASSRNVLG